MYHILKVDPLTKIWELVQAYQSKSKEQKPGQKK